MPFLNTQNIYIKKKKKENKKISHFFLSKKNIDHRARRNQIEEIQDPPDFERGSNWNDSKFFEFPGDTKLMIKKKKKKKMRLTPRDLQRGLKLTVLYWARWTCRSVLGCLNICKHFSSITIKRNGGSETSSGRHRVIKWERKRQINTQIRDDRQGGDGDGCVERRNI